MKSSVKPSTRPWPRPRLGSEALAPLMALLALAGMGVSALLLWLYYQPTSPLCTGVGECQAVATSDYAHIGPVPVALLGLLGYGAMTALTPLRQTWAATALTSLALAALAYSSYLTYVEMAVIQALCPWCLASQGLVTALATLSLLRLALLDLSPSPR